MFCQVGTPRSTMYPLETIRVPRITFHDAFSGEDTDEKVHDKDQLGRAQYKGGDADKDINRLLGLQEDVLRWIVNPAHLTANTNNVHGEKHAIRSNKRQPEMEFTHSFVHEPAEHLGEPEVQARKCRKQRCDSHDEVEVRHDKIRILQLNICGRCTKVNSAQTTADKHRHETYGEQPCGRKPD